MEEQDKAQESVIKKSSNTGKTVIKIIIGMILILFGLIALIRWWPSLWTIIKGCIGLLLILAGVITLAIAKE
ncbi:MAG: hypothetical protein WC412_04195 [Candidatus Omnitrophota bacterium]|jgi:1,4-dihydroxy-2-naphthoate octaprenyltransferase